MPRSRRPLSRLVSSTALLVVSGWLVAAGPAAADQSEAIDLQGTWFVLVHYRDEATANPDSIRWLDLVWRFARKGQRLEWTEHPLVVFEDPAGRFEARGGNPRARVLAAWEPNEQQMMTIREGPRVNARGHKSKTLRGSDEKGWNSARPRVQASAAVLGYHERLRVEGLMDKPVFVREDMLGNASQRSEGRTRYEVSEVLDGGNTLLGRYERDGIKHGTFRMWKTAPARGLIEKPGTPNERDWQAAKEALAEAKSAGAEDLIRRAEQGDADAIRQIREQLREKRDRRDH